MNEIDVNDLSLKATGGGPGEKNVWFTIFTYVIQFFEGYRMVNFIFAECY